MVPQFVQLHQRLVQDEQLQHAFREGFLSGSIAHDHSATEGADSRSPLAAARRSPRPSKRGDSAPCSQGRSGGLKPRFLRLNKSRSATASSAGASSCFGGRVKRMSFRHAKQASGKKHGRASARAVPARAPSCTGPPCAGCIPAGSWPSRSAASPSTDCRLPCPGRASSGCGPATCRPGESGAAADRIPRSAGCMRPSRTCSPLRRPLPPTARRGGGIGNPGKRSPRRQRLRKCLAHALVARQQFVAALAAQHDLDVTGRFPRQIPGRDAAEDRQTVRRDRPRCARNPARCFR